MEAGVTLKQVKILENVADRASPEAIPLRLFKLRHFLTREQDIARVRPQNSGDQMQESCFARAAFAL